MTLVLLLFFSLNRRFFWPSFQPELQRPRALEPLSRPISPLNTQTTQIWWVSSSPDWSHRSQDRLQIWPCRSSATLMREAADKGSERSRVYADYIGQVFQNSKARKNENFRILLFVCKGFGVLRTIWRRLGTLVLRFCYGVNRLPHSKIEELEPDLWSSCFLSHNKQLD